MSMTLQKYTIIKAEINVQAKLSAKIWFILSEAQHHSLELESQGIANKQRKERKYLSLYIHLGAQNVLAQ